jgi:undecaprenyl phosphate-alpha-L-ara4N flippase subunit ArnE
MAKMKKKTAKPILLIILCTIFTATGQLLMKLGINSLELSFIGLITNFQLIIGIIVYIIGAAIMIYALKQAELSSLYPFLSLSFIWVAFLSVFVLKESIFLLQGFGMLAILAGVYTVGRGAGYD